MMKENLFKILPLILLSGAIALSPAFPFFTLPTGRVIGIRVEDILIVVLGLVWFANFLISGKKKIEKPPLFFPILAWLGISSFSLLINWISRNFGFFYFLKEIDFLKEIGFFFLYFYLFYHIKKIGAAKFIVKVWIFLGLINVGWIIYEIVKGLRITYYYGPTAFMEAKTPFASSGFFVILFIFLFNILLFYYLKLNISIVKKIILGLLIISLTIGVLASGSRTSFWGLIFGLFITFSLYFLREKKLKVFLVFILTIGFIMGFLFLASSSSISHGIRRALSLEKMIQDYTLETGPPLRIVILKTQLKLLAENPLFLIFGFGEFEEAHSQYMRNLLERGIIGSVVFLFLIFIIIKKALQGFSRKEDSFSLGLASGLFVATCTMLLMSIPNDAFKAVRIGEVYWFFAGLTMAILTLSEKKNKINYYEKSYK